MTLLARAREAGLAVSLDRARELVVRGPKRLAPLAEAVLAHGAEVRVELDAEAASEDVLARLTLAHLAEPPAGPAAGAVEATAIPVSHRLVLVRHEHRCRCGRQFKCTAPSCARKEIVCVCCKLDEIGRRHADRKGSR